MVRSVSVSAPQVAQSTMPMVPQADVSLGDAEGNLRKATLTKEGEAITGKKDTQTAETGARLLAKDNQLFALDAIAKLSTDQALALLSSPVEVHIGEAPAAPPGEALKRFEALAQKLDPSRVPNPNDVAPAFQPDLQSLARPGLANALKADLTAMPNALHTLAALQRQPSPEQKKRVELIAAYTKLIEADTQKRTASAEQGATLHAQLDDTVRVHLEKAQEVVAASFQSYMSKDRDERIADITNPIPVIPDADVRAMEDAIRGVRTSNELVAKAGARKVMLIGGNQPKQQETTQSQLFNDFKNGDVESLLIITMMLCTRTEEDLLRDQMQELQKINAQKKGLREVRTHMKQSQAKMESQMQTEFNELKQSGQIHPSHKFDEYKAWRQVQWADVGADPAGNPAWPEAQLEQPVPEIPRWLAEPVDGPKAATQAKTNVAQGDQYGFPPAVMKMLTKLFNQLPKSEKANYSDMNDWMSSQGFMPVQYVPDDVKANLALVNDILKDYQKSADRTKPTNLITAEMVNDPSSSVNKAVKEIVMLTALAAAFPAGPQKDVLVAKLNTDNDALKRMLAKPCADKDAVQEAVAALVNKYSAMTSKNFGLIKQSMQTLHDNPVTAFVAGSVGKEGMSTTGSLPVWDNLDEEQARMRGDSRNIFEDAWQAGEDVLEFFFGSNDVEDAFPGGNSLGRTDEGSSEQTENSFGADGYVFKVKWSEEDDKDDDGEFTVRKPAGAPTGADADTQDWFASVQGFLGAASGRLDDKTIDAAIRGASSLGADALMGKGAFAVTGPNAGGNDGSGQDLLEQDELSDIGEKVGKYLKEIDDPKSSFGRWIGAHDYDGSKAAAKKEKEAKAQQAKADAAKAKGEAAGPATGTQGDTLDFKGGLAEFDAFCDTIKDKLDTLGGMSDTEQMRLQMMMDRRSKFIEALSNLIKKIDQTADVVVGNIK